MKVILRIWSALTENHFRIWSKRFLDLPIETRLLLCSNAITRVW